MTTSQENDEPRPHSEPGLLEKVAAALQEYGRPAGTTAPYRKVDRVRLLKTAFNPAGNRMTASIMINWVERTPFAHHSEGRSFELTEDHVAEMAKTAPGRFRADFEQIAEKISARKKAEMEKQKKAAIEADKRQMREALASPGKAAALKAPVTAPRRARFTKRPDA